MAVLFTSVATITAGASQPLKQYPPDEAQPGDPGLSRVSNEESKAAYLDTITTMRALGWDTYGTRWEKYKDQELYQYLQRERLERERNVIVRGGLEGLQEAPVNWHAYRAALWAARAGFYRHSGYVPVARAALKIPRPEKISDTHGMSIKETLNSFS